MKGYPLTVNIYAENEAEVEEARKAIVAFINSHAQQGRAVTGKKIAEAVVRWDKNPFVKNQIINFLRQ